jgi:DNA (cytosine-5)-methyltransferase 1
VKSKSKAAPFRVLDLFSGCGGLSLGLHWAQSETGQAFETVAAVDNWEISCKTYEHNLGLTPICAGVSGKVISEILASKGPIDIIIGGPPCQGFSTSGKRALGDPRNKLVVEFLNAVKLANPKAFIMENVVGFTTFQDGKLLEEVRATAEKLGYRVRAGIVQASIVGVPQRRRRFILVGIKGGEFVFPGEVLSRKEAKPKASLLDVDLTFRDGEELWSFEDAVSDLAELDAGTTDNRYVSKPQNKLQSFLRDGAKAPTDHTAVGHRPDFVRMMSYIPEGRSAIDPEINITIPKDIRPRSGYPNSYMRIKRNNPAPTITRNFTTPSSANCIHPTQNRALSIREGARCQSFPDTFEFLGSTEEKRLQIGNAVPPLLGKALGEQLLSALASSKAS